MWNNIKLWRTGSRVEYFLRIKAPSHLFLMPMFAFCIFGEYVGYICSGLHL